MKLSKRAIDLVYVDFCDMFFEQDDDQLLVDKFELFEYLKRLNLTFKSGDSSQSELDIVE